MSNDKPHHDSLRSRTVKVGLACLILAAIANVSVIGISRVVEGKRADQVRLANLRVNCFELVSLLDHGDAVGSVAAAETKLAVITKEVGTLAVTYPKVGFAAPLDSFRTAVANETAAYRSGDPTEAKRLAGVTYPSFLVLDQTLREASAARKREAKVGAFVMDCFVTGSFILVGALIAVLFGLHQRRTLAMLASRSGLVAAEASERRFRSMVRNTADVIAVTTAEGTLKLISEASERLFGARPDDLIGQSVHDLVYSEDSALLKEAFAAVLAESGATNVIEIHIVTADGTRRPFQVTLNNLTQDPDVQGMLLTCHDLSERKRLEDELTYNAFHDLLTGLPNRALFMDRLSHQLRTRGGETPHCAVLFIDLDNFKVINDSLGHAVGDELLIQVSRRLAGAVRPGDTVARIGGDEFTVLLVGVTNFSEASRAAQRLLATLEDPFTLEGREMIVSASMGIALSDRAGVDAYQILRDADTAMYAAKAQGKNSFAVFDRKMNDIAMDRLELETELRQAIENRELVLFYQPIVDMASGELREVEVLLRWNHPSRGILGPRVFIAIAEETNLVCPIGEWVLREACSQLARWDRTYRRRQDLGVTVNVSGRQLRQPGFVAMLSEILRAHDIDPKRIKLDISETAMLRDFESARTIIEEIRALGIKIAIDDFGTSHSTISFLSRLPVDTLKIDGMFIAPLGMDMRSRGVVGAMISMARTLGLQVTSEGIETQEQLDVLRTLGCDAGQGNHFQRPGPVDSIDKLLAGPTKNPLAGTPS